MEGAIGLLKDELGELKGEMASLKEGLQQIFRNQQEMSRMMPPSGQDPSLMGVSPTSYPFPLSENSTTPSLIHTNHKYRRLEIPIFTGENLDEWLSRAECFFDLHKII